MTPRDRAASVVARYNLLTGEDREQYLREMIAAAIAVAEREAECPYCEKFVTAPDASRPTNAEIAKVVGWLLDQLAEKRPRPDLDSNEDIVWLSICSYLQETLEAHTP